MQEDRRQMNESDVRQQLWTWQQLSWPEWIKLPTHYKPKTSTLGSHTHETWTPASAQHPSILQSNCLRLLPGLQRSRGSIHSSQHYVHLVHVIHSDMAFHQHRSGAGRSWYVEENYPHSEAQALQYLSPNPSRSIHAGGGMRPTTLLYINTTPTPWI